MMLGFQAAVDIRERWQLTLALMIPYVIYIRAMWEILLLNECLLPLLELEKLNIILEDYYDDARRSSSFPFLDSSNLVETMAAQSSYFCM